MEESRAIGRFGYLSCRQASSFATLGWIQMRKSHVLARGDATTKLRECIDHQPRVTKTTKRGSK
jgi:hypothetical protein